MAIADELDLSKSELGTLISLVDDHSRLNKVIARGLSQTVKKHLGRRDKTHPNKLGGKRTHYWEQAAKGTHGEHDKHGATVTVSHLGIRLQYFGGQVEAGRNPSFVTGQPTKFLTIPAIAEAHGKRAKEFDGLKALYRSVNGKVEPFALAIPADGAVQIVGKGGGNKVLKAKPTPKGKGAIQSKRQKGAAKKAEKETKHAKIVFWLLRSAHVKPHPDVLPSRQKLLDAAIQAGKKFIETL